MAGEIVQPVKIDDAQAAAALKRLKGLAGGTDTAFEELGKTTGKQRDAFGRFVKSGDSAKTTLGGVAGASNQAAKGLKGVEGASGAAASVFAGLSSSGGMSALAIGAVAAASLVGVNALFELGERALGVASGFADVALEGEKVAGLKAGFEAIGGTSKDLDELRQATSGLVSDGDLLKIANQAKLFNIPADQIANLTKLAVGAGTLMGIDTAKASEDIFTGIARGSVMIIDNLGISLGKLGKINSDFAGSVGKAANDLSAEEKQLALIQATLAGGQRQMEAASIGGFGASEAAVGFENLTQTMQVLAAEMFNSSGISKVLVDAFKQVGDFAAKNSDVIGELVQSGFELFKVMGAAVVPTLMELVPIVGDLAGLFSEVAPFIQFTAAILGELAGVVVSLVGGALSLLRDGLKALKGDFNEVAQVTGVVAKSMKTAELAIKKKADADLAAAAAAVEHSEAVKKQISGAELAIRLAGAQAEAEAILAKSVLSTAADFGTFIDAQQALFKDTETAEGRSDALATSITTLGGSYEDQLSVLDQYIRSQNSIAATIAKIDAELIEQHGIQNQTNKLYTDTNILLDRKLAIQAALNVTDAEANILSGQRVTNLLAEASAMKASTEALLKQADEEAKPKKKRRRGPSRADQRRKDALELADAERAGRIALLSEVDQSAVEIGEKYNNLIAGLKGSNDELATQLAGQRVVDLAAFSAARGAGAAEAAAKAASERGELFAGIFAPLDAALDTATDKISDTFDKWDEIAQERAASASARWKDSMATVTTSFLGALETMATGEGTQREKMAKGMGELFGQLSTAFIAWAVAEGNLLAGNPVAAAVAAFSLGAVASAISAFGARKPASGGGGGAAAKRALDRDQDRKETPAQMVVINYGFQAPAEVGQEVRRAGERAARREPRRAAA